MLAHRDAEREVFGTGRELVVDADGEREATREANVLDAAAVERERAPEEAEDGTQRTMSSVYAKPTPRFSTIVARLSLMGVPSGLLPLFSWSATGQNAPSTRKLNASLKPYE